MKKVLCLSLFLCLGFLSSIQAQDLTGYWQGLEKNPGAMISEAWPTIMQVKANEDPRFFQIAANSPNLYVKFQMKKIEGEDNNFQLLHYEVLEDNKGGMNIFWCLGIFSLRYDPELEKISGHSNFFRQGCPDGYLELFRVKLKSKPVVCYGEETVLEVTGKNIRWYEDREKRKLVGTGNTLPVKLYEDKNYYVTQSFNGIEGKVTPIALKVSRPEIVSSKQSNPRDGKRNGTIKVVGKGDKPLRFKIDDQAWQNSASFRKLRAGKHRITMIDASGCETDKQLSLVTRKPRARFIYLEGNVWDRKQENASFRAQLQLRSEGGKSFEIQTDERGYYRVRVTANTNYTIEASAPEYEAKTISLRTQSKDMEQFIFLVKKEREEKEEVLVVDKPLVLGTRVQLENVFFAENESRLLPAAFPALAELVILMTSDETMEIRLEGHTDKVANAATKEDHLKLSEARVKAVKEYLVGKGIAANRIATQGLGFSKLLYPAPNPLNRRVEFVVTKLGKR